MKIKICGITNMEDADYSILKGAEFIGVILDKKIKRHGDEDLIKEIKKIHPDIKVVGVYTDMPVNRDINEDILQLHFPHTSRDIIHVKNEFKKEIISVININNENYLDKLKEYIGAGSDYILLEDKNGIINDREKISQLNMKRIAIAGKIDSRNITALIPLNPAFIDISSSLEERIGKKSFKKIDELFNMIGDINVIR